MWSRVRRPCWILLSATQHITCSVWKTLFKWFISELSVVDDSSQHKTKLQNRLCIQKIMCKILHKKQTWTHTYREVKSNMELANYWPPRYSASGACSLTVTGEYLLKFNWRIRASTWTHQQLLHVVLRAPAGSPTFVSCEGVERFTVYYSRIPIKQFQARLNIWNIQNKFYYPFSSCLHLSRISKQWHRQHTQINSNNPDRCNNTFLSSPGVKI